MSFQRRQFECHRYTMVELVFALGLLAILAICLTKSLQTLKGMNRFYSKENRAVMVLDNTVERLSQRASISVADVETVFADEYQRSSLKDETDLKPVCNLRENSVYLQILRENGKPIAEIRLPCNRKTK